MTWTFATCVSSPIRDHFATFRRLEHQIYITCRFWFRGPETILWWFWTCSGARVVGGSTSHSTRKRGFLLRTSNFFLSSSLLRLLVITFIQIREMESTLLANWFGFITLREVVLLISTRLFFFRWSRQAVRTYLDLSEFTCFTTCTWLLVRPMWDGIGVVKHLKHFAINPVIRCRGSVQLVKLYDQNGVRVRILAIWCTLSFGKWYAEEPKRCIVVMPVEVYIGGRRVVVWLANDWMACLGKQMR